jgi:hypothetical protein
MRGTNDDVSSRMTKMLEIGLDPNYKCICNSTNKGDVFPMFDTIEFKIQRNFKDIDLQLGLIGCKVQHIALLEFQISKVSEKHNAHDLYHKNFNHAFLPKPDFEGYRNNDEKEFEENQNYIGDEEFHQEPDHPVLL